MHGGAVCDYKTGGAQAGRHTALPCPGRAPSWPAHQHSGLQKREPEGQVVGQMQVTEPLGSW